MKSSPRLRCRADLNKQAKIAVKPVTFDSVAKLAYLSMIARLTVLDCHRLVVHLAKRPEKEANRVIDCGQYSTPPTPPCACKTEAKAEFQEEFKKAHPDTCESVVDRRGSCRFELQAAGKGSSL